ncbi:peptidylprolyl isomerase [Thalassotalea ponticola]|uniref:FKBP-type peptidyl-prolyl cis-trans isomerase n=1 Tax=Thalassotalea ponticola TaxID=1523392 RepID=UPI0025B5EE35|nr:peptidylprolyl isomerase [Thalassotalea ponticola]MDN3653239.1 peptidylprolyl isomerase [Thalassotalea ponticola]
MKIDKNTVVQFHYVLKDDKGNTVEDSRASDPIAILVGHSNMIVGVENALMGKQKGDSFSVTVAPQDGYGEYVAGAEQRVPVKHLQGASKWKPGMVAIVNTDQGQRQVTVVKVGRFMITVDTNHPFAGKTLEFDIDVIDVREAEESEISHGHAHGVGGHQH